MTAPHTTTALPAPTVTKLRDRSNARCSCGRPAQYVIETAKWGRLLYCGKGGEWLDSLMARAKVVGS